MMTKVCPACSAELPNTAAVCEYCGSSILPLALSVQEHESIKAFAQELNDRLIRERKRFERIIFSIFAGIVLVSLLSLIALYHIYQFTILNLIFFLLAVIILAYIVSATIYRRKTNQAFHRSFEKKINPDLKTFLSKEGLPRWQFDQIAQQALQPGAPLKRFLLGDKTTGGRNRGRII
jgi:small-conductance mechanosensitive channel